MKAKSSAHYQREYRKRLRDQGFVKKEVWILPDNAKLLAECEKKLRLRDVGSSMVGEIETGELFMTTNKSSVDVWVTSSLLEALRSEELFVGGAASIELIDGVNPSIHIEMKEFGDLPIFVTVSGDQVIVEAVLWSLEEVSDVAAFNDAI